MFWIVWLPISVLCIGIIVTISRSIRKKDSEVVSTGIGLSLAIAFVVFMVGGLISQKVAETTPSQTVYVDLENPIYLAPVPDGNEGIYLYSDGDIDMEGRYVYYYIGSPPIYPEYPQDSTIAMSQVRIVYDSPNRPFFAYIRHTCKADYFWLLDCKSTSPYTMEFHLPPNSVKPLP